MSETSPLTARDGHELTAYLARPRNKPKGGIVVVQEIFGVNKHIRSVCDGFAEVGYLTIAPAIFDRVERNVQLNYTANDVVRGREIRGRCDVDAVMLDLAAAAAAVATAGKVGIVGYCWGGLLTYIAACRLGNKFTCASSYYGGSIVAYVQEKPATPLILHFGDLDSSIPLTDVEKIAAAHPAARVYVYEGADHGFNCDLRKQFNPAAATLARKRTLDFFATHLT